MNLDTIKDELLSVADSGINYAKNKLPDAEIELYLTQSSQINVDIQGGMVMARDSEYTGSAVRIYYNRKKSFACTSGISLDNLKHTIKEAIAISKSISFVDERFNSLYAPNGKKSSNEGIIDPEILTLNSKVVGDEANQLVQDSKIDNRIVSIAGSRMVSSGAYAVVNSSGVSSASRYTVNIAEIESIAKEGNKQKSSFDYCVTRNLKDYDQSKLGINASKQALALLDSKPLNKSEILPTVWDHVAGSLYLKTALDFSISGKSVVEGDSYFADKIGAEVAKDTLTIVDDGQLPDAISTNAIDGEGVPSQKTRIIEKGVLKSYVTDSYYGHLMDSPSTGNAKRIGNPTYEGLPDIATNTLSIESEKSSSFDEIIQEINYGVYVKGFLLGIMHTNPVTGDMSAVGPSAFLIENGEIKHALEPVNIAGNIYKNLKNISKVGTDSILTPFGVKTPTLVIDGFTVTG